MPEYLEYRYSPAARTVMSVLTVVIYVTVTTTAVLYSGATALETIFGLSLPVAIAVICGIAIGYVLWGGPSRRGMGRSLPGLGPARGRAPDPRPRARRGGRAGRLPPGERRPLAHDPAPQPPRAAVDGARGRDVDPDLLLLRPQPVHHPAHARRALARAGTGGDRPCRGALAPRALRDRDAGRGGAPAVRGRDRAAGSGLPDADPGAGADGAARLHPRRPRRAR